ncbi:septum formation protein [Rhizobium sp. RU35A]|uniref:dTTP/UTP pyrophosphatase n=1 Tax=Rhizobium straminoryzae TaxID=1387186 RepID=A0A549TI88_9HYPH|nr:MULTISPECIES: Maf-like protein [Rhizobium]TRL42959.1 Maf-like protein [Rhizobium straminoryzae]SIQ03301.1 septum formation protein [Rhizobium sp. RU35A]
MSLDQKLILASGSPRRLDLLNQVGIKPARLMPMDIDESPKKSEHPRSLARRLSSEKAEAALAAIQGDAAWRSSYILSADTVVAVGRRILSKTEYMDEASAALHLLSGRGHWVYTGVCLVTPGGQFRQKVVETKVRFKRLSEREIAAYLASDQWRGKAGAYAIQGIAASFVQKLVGSYTNVVGLPLYETSLLLNGEGFEVSRQWADG